MTIDERLEKLAERHESLAQTVELLAIDRRETDRQIAALGVRIDGLTTIVMQLVTGTASLLRTAEAHERRISSLEAGA